MRNSSGPDPASTQRPSGTAPVDFSSVCAAPHVITPGSVQPGIGTGRSIAPVAISIRFAARRDAPPLPRVYTLHSPSICHTVVSGRYSALLARNRLTRVRPAA
jgi:hypothetical protein